MEELVKFTYLTEGVQIILVDRYGERVETAEQLSVQVTPTPVPTDDKDFASLGALAGLLVLVLLRSAQQLRAVLSRLF